MGFQKPKLIQANYKDLEPDYKEDGYFSAYNYQPLLESYGFKIIVQEDENSYQGDSFVLYQHEELFGILIFGWGSCSGCDALQACGSPDEVMELRKELFREIKWFDKIRKLQEYINSKNRDYSYYGSSSAWDNFKKGVNKEIAVLAKILRSV